MKDELLRRQNNTEKLIGLFRAKPQQWIGVHELAHVAGFAAWRTRVSDCREIFEKEGGSLVWNQNAKESCYMFKPYVSLGRSSDTITPQTWTSDGPFTPEFQLTACVLPRRSRYRAGKNVKTVEFGDDFSDLS